MNMNHSNQRGSVMPIVIGLIVIVLLGTVGYMFVSLLTEENGNSNNSASGLIGDSAKSESADTPPLKLKSIGINLGEYDPATGKAGDMVFTKMHIEGYKDVIFFDYGAVAEANSAAQRRLNPQPTFIVPLGTKVHSLVDGVVVNVPKLYSNDYSIQVGTSKDSQWLYETEHVINPLVKVGDKVKAGQVIAEVSTHDSQYHPGFGLYEIGILHAGNPPTHVCPFNYLDDSIKDSVWKNLTEFYKAWEEYRGDTKLYDESKHVVPGCYTLDPVEG